MKTTRDHDIGNIEEKISKGVYSRKKGKELIDKMHGQTKDSNIEGRRKKLIEDQKKEDRDYKMLRTEPNKMNKEQLREYIKYFNQNPHEY